jgi:hypothetical protein
MKIPTIILFVLTAILLFVSFFKSHNLPFSLAFLGKDIFIAKFISCLIFPILGGLIASLIFK